MGITAAGGLPSTISTIADTNDATTPGSAFATVESSVALRDVALLPSLASKV